MLLKMTHPESKVLDSCPSTIDLDSNQGWLDLQATPEPEVLTFATPLPSVQV